MHDNLHDHAWGRLKRMTTKANSLVRQYKFLIYWSLHLTIVIFKWNGLNTTWIQLQICSSAFLKSWDRDLSTIPHPNFLRLESTDLQLRWIWRAVPIPYWWKNYTCILEGNIEGYSWFVCFLSIEEPCPYLREDTVIIVLLCNINSVAILSFNPNILTLESFWWSSSFTVENWWSKRLRSPRVTISP